MAGLVVVGIVVWQVGKTIAFYVTIGKPVESDADATRRGEAGAQPAYEPDPDTRDHGRRGRPPSGVTGDPGGRSGATGATGSHSGTEAGAERSSPDRDVTGLEVPQG